MKRTALAIGVLVVAACHGDRVLPPPTALIQDALHNDGNAFFFWTPPIVHQQPPASQVFSKNLSPVLTITSLCTGAVVRTFAGSHLQVSDANYQANWRTSEDNLNAACTYRLTVTVASKTLGFADVDVVDNGRELKNVNTDEFIALLDDRTLPIKFFIGVGALCQRAGSDCGEGLVRPDQNTVIVTTNGQAGVFVPAGAVSRPVTIIIESSDDRPCFEGLLPPVFPGKQGATGNSCYDYRTDPPLSEINDGGKFQEPVTVGICVDVSALDHVTQDLLQIYQFDVFGERVQIRALNNVAAPFLRCDPGFDPTFGARPSSVFDLAARGLRSLLRPIATLVTPPALFASSRAVVLDVGTGGSTDEFSRFTWALPADITINFDVAPDGSAVAPGTLVNALYSPLGVTFTRTNPEGLCAGSGVYANDHGPGGFGSGQNNVTPCPEGVASDFSEAEYGALQATFSLPAVQACVNATPLGFRGSEPGAQAYIEAFSATGESLGRMESTTERVSQRLCVSGTGISYARFAGKEAGFAIFDNFFVARSLPQID
ncbi:MAG: hypothetical protein ACREMI_01265 [Gemmatimonadales bacterium]